MSPSASQTGNVHVPFTEIFNYGTLRYMKWNLLTQSQYHYWEAERGITASSRFLELLKIHSPEVCSLSLLMTRASTRLFVIPVLWEALMLKSHGGYDNDLIYSYLNIIIQALRWGKGDATRLEDVYKSLQIVITLLKKAWAPKIKTISGALKK